VSPTIAWIHVAPVKGLALVPRDEVELEGTGVRDDRRFFLIGGEGRLLNLKQVPPLAQITAEWDDGASHLALRFPDGSTVAGEVELGEALSTNFYGRRQVEGRLVAGPWSEAITSFAGRTLELVQANDQNDAIDRGRGAPVSLLGTASLEALREAAGVDEPVDPRRFRMLFGVEGTGAHEEDAWVGRRLQIGGAEIELEGNIGRCIVTSRHPDTGVRNLPTLDVIAEYRATVEATEPLPFGVWGTVVTPGRVRLGDAIEPL
jgi:uncharacterized protein YcbX